MNRPQWGHFTLTPSPNPTPSSSRRAHISTAGWGEQTAGTFACSRPAFRLWKMKNKMYITCKEEKILREAKGKSTIWGQWPVIAIVRSRVQARVPRESTPRDAKEINFQINSWRKHFIGQQWKGLCFDWRNSIVSPNTLNHLFLPSTLKVWLSKWPIKIFHNGNKIQK